MRAFDVRIRILPSRGGYDMGYLYKRVLLKLSGEALAGEAGYGVDPTIVEAITDQVGDIVRDGVQVAIVIGGGNIFRGVAGSAKGI